MRERDSERETVRERQRETEREGERRERERESNSLMFKNHLVYILMDINGKVNYVLSRNMQQ